MKQTPAKTLSSIVAMMLLCHPSLRSADDFNVLPDNFNSDKTQQMMRSYLRGLSHAALDERLEELEALKTAGQIEAYQKERRDFFLRTIGGPPPETPLNPRVTGRLEYPEYAVEKIIFESLPNFHVTASLYLPKGQGAGPHPGVLLPCGHSANGKAAEPYQLASILLARNGFAVLCWDPVGQGERMQLLDVPNAPAGTSEHMAEGVAPILLGRNLATYMIWDGMRALDYLQSRPEVDPERIGCTGISGGGNLTAMLMALDPRIDAAAPGCFMTTHRMKNESPGPGDAEQNLFDQIRQGFDHPDFIITRAPKPTLILAATYDYVPIEGAWLAYRQAKRIYGKLGFPERVQLAEANEKHGFGPELRQATTRFMLRFLSDDLSEITEPPNTPIAKDAELQSTPDGQVLKLPGARSIFAVNQDFSKQLRQQREKFIATTPPEDRLEKVRQLANIRPLEEIPAVKPRSLGTVQLAGFPGEKMIFEPEPGILLPAIDFHPDKAGGETVLYLNENGKTADSKAIIALLEKGQRVLAVDVRDSGETRTHIWRYGRAANITGPATAEFFMAYMLGKSYLGMRAEDILACARYLSEDSKPKAKIHLIATGELAPPALHAAALEPQLFSSTVFKNSLESWQEVIDTPVTDNQLVNTVHGALKFYDLPDLAAWFDKSQSK